MFLCVNKRCISRFVWNCVENGKMKAIKLENDFPRVDGNPVASKMRAKEIAKKIVSLLSQAIVSYNLCGVKNTSISINGRG